MRAEVENNDNACEPESIHFPRFFSQITLYDINTLYEEEMCTTMGR
jgi:hypothetical protein